MLLWLVTLWVASNRGGLLLGGLAGVYYSVQLLSSIARAKRDYRDTMAAALATGIVFGAARAHRCPETAFWFECHTGLGKGRLIAVSQNPPIAVAAAPSPATALCSNFVADRVGIEG